jgi:hypothetical protein
MPHESLRHLRLDRRLRDRRGWISKDELEREIAALPDVSEKIAPAEETAPGEAEAGEEPRRGR